MSRKVTINNDYKSLLLPYWRNLLKKTLFDGYIQQMLCKIMGYDKYVKDKDLLIVDALSRSETTNQNRSKMEQEIETNRLVHEDQSL